MEYPVINEGSIVRFISPYTDILTEGVVTKQYPTFVSCVWAESGKDRFKCFHKGCITEIVSQPQLTYRYERDIDQATEYWLEEN